MGKLAPARLTEEQAEAAWRALRKAAGRPVDITKDLDATPQAISLWKYRIPQNWVLVLSDKYGVPEHVLRPDRYRVPANEE